MNYAAGNYAQAAFYFEQLVIKDPVDQLDKAVEQTVAFLAEQRRRSATSTNRVYQSQEVLLFGLGALHRILGDTAAARQDLSQSLTENMAFFPAHAELADMALDAGDTAQAVAAYTQAVELAPDDGVLHYRYARLLSTVGRLADAESELRRAIQLEPFFAPPYLGLALVLETRGNAAEAAEHYRGYLARTNRGDPRIEMARAPGTTGTLMSSSSLGGGVKVDVRD